MAFKFAVLALLVACVAAKETCSSTGLDELAETTYIGCSCREITNGAEIICDKGAVVNDGYIEVICPGPDPAYPYHCYSYDISLYPAARIPLKYEFLSNGKVKQTIIQELGPCEAIIDLETFQYIAGPEECPPISKSTTIVREQDVLARISPKQKLWVKFGTGPVPRP